MRSSIAFIANCIVGLAAFHSACAESLLIPADKIYTEPNAKPLLNGAVLIRDGRIASVADEHARIAVPKGTRTSDCRGVVVAGFQNSHVHFTEDVWSDAGNAPRARLQQGLEAMLTRYGYTTVFDTGSDQANTIALRKRVDKGDLRGPRIFTAGLPLYPPDGIPFYIHDLPADVLARMHQPRDAEEARAAVRQNMAAGADATKLFLVTSPTADFNTVKLMTLEVAKAAVDETHKHGKLALAHPTSLEGIRLALAAGVDVLVHTTLGERSPWDEGLVKQMTAQNLSVMPTFKLWTYELHKADVPPAIIEKLVASTEEELRAFKRADGQILFGTDVGYMHEYDPTEEYAAMARAGLTAAQVLASLTTAPAARWKESDRHGRIVAGMDADIVVLNADPADDITSFAKVRCVFRGGELIYFGAAGALNRMRPSGKKTPLAPDKVVDPKSAKVMAVTLLARRDFSSGELRRKLKERGYAEEAISPVLTELENARVVDDRRFGDNLVASRARRGQGPHRIRGELRRSGLSAEMVQNTMDQAKEDGPDFIALARAARRRKFGDEIPEDRKERARQARFLQYRGFSTDHIRAVLAGVEEDLDPGSEPDPN